VPIKKTFFELKTKSDLTLIEINVICEVPIYFKNTKKKKIQKNKYKKRKMFLIYVNFMLILC